MKTAEETLSSVFEEEGFTVHFALNLHPQQNLKNDPAYRRIIFAMIKYAEQFKPKWIPVSSRLPEVNKQVFVWCRIYGRYVTTLKYLESGLQWKGHDGTYGGLPPVYWAEIIYPEPPEELAEI